MTHIFKRTNRPCRSEDILFIIAVYVVHLDRKPGYDFPCIVKSKLKRKKVNNLYLLNTLGLLTILQPNGLS